MEIELGLHDVHEVLHRTDGGGRQLELLLISQVTPLLSKVRSSNLWRPMGSI